MSEPRPSLAVVVLTFNNADILPRCLTSLQWVDEIILYDSGSSDDTAAVAAQFNAKLIVDEVWDGFGRQRQKAQQAVSCDWVLWIDSDEVVTPQLQQHIQSTLLNADLSSAYSVNRLSDFFGRFIRHSGWYPDRITRLHHRDSYTYDDAIVHEKIKCPADKIKALQGDLLHYTTPSFSDYMGKSLRYANDWAQARFARGKRVSVIGIALRTLFAFIRKYILKKGFLDGAHGFLLAIQSSHYTFNKYFALWILQQRQK